MIYASRPNSEDQTLISASSVLLHYPIMYCFVAFIKIETNSEYQKQIKQFYSESNHSWVTENISNPPGQSEKTLSIYSMLIRGGYKSRKGGIIKRKKESHVLVNIFLTSQWCRNTSELMRFCFSDVFSHKTISILKSKLSLPLSV